MNKKALESNRLNKIAIVNQLAGLYRSTDDSELSEQFHNLKETIEHLPDTDSEKAISVDVKILEILDELSKTSTSSKNLLNNLFAEMKAQVVARRELSIVYAIPLTKKDRQRQERNNKKNQKVLAKLKKAKDKTIKAFNSGKLTDENVIKAIIEEDVKLLAKLRDEEVTLENKCADIYDNIEKYNHESDITELRIKDNDLRCIRDQIQFLESEREALSAQKANIRRGKVRGHAKQVIKATTPSVIAENDQNAKEKDDIDNAMRSMRDSQLIGHENVQAQSINVQGMVSDQASVTPHSSTTQTNNPYRQGIRTSSAEGNPYRHTSGRTGASMRLEDYFENVDEQLIALETAMFNVESAHKDKSKELLKVADELRELLTQRKTASAAECKTLDGKIDVRERKYATLKRGIDRLDQDRAQYSNEMSIVEQIRDIRDSAERRKNIAEISGNRFADFAHLAAALSKATEALNKSFEDVQDAVAVADNPPITNRTYASIGNSYEAEIKDEDKYAGLERELNIR